jgi:hypothetical protein
MSTIKTTVNAASVSEFLAGVPDEKRRADGLALLELFETTTGEKPRMWGSSLVGFGSYHYKSERSKQEGEWPLAAFSPRKQYLTLYISPGFDNYRDLLDKLGKHKTSKGCLYINKLADVDLTVLKQLVQRSYEDMERSHSV